MRSLLAGAALVAALLVSTASANADVVSGSLTDRKGDGETTTGVHPYDLKAFGLRYDADESRLTASYELYDMYPPPGSAGFDYTVSAEIATWSHGACDVQSDGGVRLKLVPNFMAPVPYSFVVYSVAGYNGGAEQRLQVYWPDQVYIVGGVVFFTFADSAAFAARGYNCVKNVVLENAAGGGDHASKTFCMSPAGTIACTKLRKAR
jgi:hypothetical protein